MRSMEEKEWLKYQKPHLCIDMEVVSRISTRSTGPGTKKSQETQAKDVTDDGMCMDTH